MRTHHALQPRSPEQASYSIGRRDGKQFLKLYRSYLHGTLAAHDNSGYVDVVVIADYPTGESVYKYTREPDDAVMWELIAARAKRSDA